MARPPRRSALSSRRGWVPTPSAAPRSRRCRRYGLPMPDNTSHPTTPTLPGAACGAPWPGRRDPRGRWRGGHAPARRSVVHTPHSAIRAIGTRFGVRAYGDAAAERVAVAEGAVVVAETPLRAGQVATLSRAGAVRVLHGAAVTNELAWTRGRLVFTSVPLSEAAQQLGRWYDLDVLVIDSTLARWPITGSYSNEPVSEVLTLITSAVGARYEWRGRSVTIATVRVAQ